MKKLCLDVPSTDSSSALPTSILIQSSDAPQPVVDIDHKGTTATSVAEKRSVLDDVLVYPAETSKKSGRKTRHLPMHMSGEQCIKYLQEKRMEKLEKEKQKRQVEREQKKKERELQKINMEEERKKKRLEREKKKQKGRNKIEHPCLLVGDRKPVIVEPKSFSFPIQPHLAVILSPIVQFAVILVQ